MALEHAKCVTIQCDTCEAPYGDPDLGNAWHFDSVSDAVKNAAEYRDGEDEAEGEFYAWLIQPDGSATCHQCRTVAFCVANGHTRREPMLSVRGTAHCRVCGVKLGDLAEAPQAGETT